MVNPRMSLRTAIVLGIITGRSARPCPHSIILKQRTSVLVESKSICGSVRGANSSTPLDKYGD